ncbi:hypothetical protein HDU91_006838 [Kappamyces sp. JEL0680]|nr:hypothetical protein HDU91_006838 [Kappamyces sp. JEL0680]
MPNCPLPATPECLIENAQYTVVGTITSTNLGTPGTSSALYSAQMAISCVWASFSTPVSDGLGLVNQVINVTNWVGCPNGSGATANVNDSQIYLIYVAKAAPRGEPPANALFSVFSPCTGGIALSNNGVVAQVLANNPSNAISAANRGTNAFCTLPTVTTSSGSSSSTSQSGGPATFNPSSTGSRSEAKMGVFALFLLSTLALGSM